MSDIKGFENRTVSLAINGVKRKVTFKYNIVSVLAVENIRGKSPFISTDQATERYCKSLIKRFYSPTHDCLIIPKIVSVK